MSKPSSVFATIYLGPCGNPMGTGYLVTSVAALDFRPARRATCRAQPPKVREDAAVDSEIAAGRIALFTPHLRVVLVSVALALRRGRQCGLSRPTTGLSPAFARHPALCSSDFPLCPMFPEGTAAILRRKTLPNPIVAYATTPKGGVLC